MAVDRDRSPLHRQSTLQPACMYNTAPDTFQVYAHPGRATGQMARAGRYQQPGGDTGPQPSRAGTGARHLQGAGAASHESGIVPAPMLRRTPDDTSTENFHPLPSAAWQEAHWERD